VGRPYWLDEPAPALRRHAHAARPEVVVVGGGITGVSCALALARAGVGVALHEARTIAGGASGRNGGFALRGGAMPYDRAREWLGRGEARAYWQLTEDALERLSRAAGDALDRTGSLRLAADEGERDELRVEYEALREDGFEAEWRDVLGGPLTGRFAAAIFHPPDAAVHPGRLVRRLAAEAAEAGVEIRENARVESLDAVDAEQLVVATDGYPSGLLGEVEGLIVPTRGQMIATEPIPERLFACPHYGRHGFDYWQQARDGRILAGGFRDYALATEFTAEERTTEPIQQALERFVAELVGRPVGVTHRWAGIFGLVPDLMPVVGPLPEREGAWVAGGYSGHGNVLGFACGELVAEAILGRRHPLLGLFDPARLVATPA
jgi:glycine/D-amino acid oxidase-like deaminating enzyme